MSCRIKSGVCFSKEQTDKLNQEIVQKSSSRDAFKTILKKGADPNYADDKQEAPFHKAAEKGNLVALVMMRRYGAKPNLRDKDGWNALHYAAAWNQHLAIPLLHSFGCRVNTRNGEGSTPLIQACIWGKKEAVKELLKLNANTEIRSAGNGFTAKAHALFRGHQACFDLLPDDPYTTELTKSIVVSHFNGLDGKGRIGKTSFDLEGAHAPYMRKQIAITLKAFFSKATSLLSKKTQDALVEAFEDASKCRSPQMLLTSIKAGKFVDVWAGWSDHNIELIFITINGKTYMGICNRGIGVPEGFKTIELFLIDINLLTEDVLLQIFKKQNEEADKASLFYYRELPAMLGPLITPLVKRVTQAA